MRYSRASLLLGGALLIAGAWLLIANERPVPAPETGTGTSAGVEPLAAGQPHASLHAPLPSQAIGSPAAPLELRKLRSQHAPDPEPPSRILVNGRCVDALSGEPLAGVSVALTAEPLLVRRLAELASPLAWKDPDPVATDVGGCFQFVVHPASPLSYTLAATRGGWIQFTEQRTFGAADLQQPIVLLLRQVHPTAVRVVDRERVPMPGVMLVVKVAGYQPPWPQKRIHATSDAEGIARFDPGLPRGVHDVFVASGAAPARAELEAGDPDHLLEIVVDRAPVVLAGRMVDARGEPVVGARVEARPANGWMHQVETRTDALGRFELVSQQDAKQGWELITDRPLASPPEGARKFPTGAGGVNLIVADSGAIELSIVDARTGKPVERFVVGCRLTRAWSGEEVRFDFSGHHPGGEFMLAPIPPGPCQLEVHPGDRMLAIARSQPLVVQEGKTLAIRLALEPASVAWVRVESGGRPVMDAHVELLHSARGDPPSPDAEYEPLHPPRGPNATGGVARVAEGHTDPSGVAALACQLEDVQFVRVRAVGFAPLLQPFRFVRGTVTPLELARGARLEVILRPPGMTKTLRELSKGEPPVLRIGRTGWYPLESHSLGPVECDTLTFADLAPGYGTLVLEVPWLDSIGAYGWQRPEPVIHRRDILLQAGAATRVELDLAEWRPGTLEIVVGSNPELLAGQVLVIQRAVPPVPEWEDESRVHFPFSVLRQTRWTIRTDDRGRVGSLDLLPGEYEVLVRASALGFAHDRLVPIGEGRIKIEPALRTTATLDVSASAAVLQLRAQDGQPMRDVRLRIRPAGKEEFRILVTDASGCATWFGAGTFELEFHRSDNLDRTLPPPSAWSWTQECRIQIPTRAGLHSVYATFRQER